MRKYLVISTILLSLAVLCCVLTFGIYSSDTCYADTSIGENYVYLGGQVVGININTSGLIITSKINVITKTGIVCPFQDVEVAYGDILHSINDTVIEDVEQIEQLISNDKKVNVEIKRGKSIETHSIVPVLDMITKKYKIGLLLQDKVSGIGTITYISAMDHSYAALGHPIKDVSGNSIINGKGNIYKANVVDVTKAKEGKAGELNGVFSMLGGSIGDIKKSNEFGIYGKLEKSDAFALKKVKVGHREEVREGKAKIYATIDGFNVESFDIEIVKINRQNSKADKSMVIKVIDKNLLKKSGGVVQGMSGSPIVQNDKIVGAVTHVFLSDSSKGYGIFLDWML